MPTVTGTENVLMAAALARGTTVLENCAREPEVIDLANLLNAMGARISGAGEETIVIDGVDGLGAAEHTIIPDRIEGGTYLIGAALTGGDVLLENANAADLAPLLDKLAEVGAKVEVTAEGIRVRADQGIAARDLETAPHPGFPTDLQAQYMTLMTRAYGVSTISETIFENRFQHAPELMRMGADIRVDGGRAQVHGPSRLTGAGVMATDLRASACLVLAGIAAEGETVVDRIYHLDRGYEQMELKLQKPRRASRAVVGSHGHLSSKRRAEPLLPAPLLRCSAPSLSPSPSLSRTRGRNWSSTSSPAGRPRPSPAPSRSSRRIRRPPASSASTTSAAISSTPWAASRRPWRPSAAPWA